MSRSNEQWRLVSNADWRDPSPATGLVVHRDTARYRWATRLWLAAWAPAPKGAALPVSTWTLTEGAVAVGAAVTFLYTAPGQSASVWVAAMLLGLLVVLASRWARARVAVQMPQWAAEGMTTIHQRRALTDRGTGGTLTEEAWTTLCSRAAADQPLPQVEVEAVREWIAARDHADYTPGAVTDFDLRAVQQATSRVAGVAA